MLEKESARSHKCIEQLDAQVAEDGARIRELEAWNLELLEFMSGQAFAGGE